MKGNLTCPHRNVSEFTKDFLSKIKLIENDLGELNISSGLRCLDCNKKVDGVPDSAHTAGQAVDINVPNSNYRYKLIRKCVLLDINRIGVGKTFVHIDIDKSKPVNVCWDYYQKG